MTIIQAQPLKQFGISGPASALDNEIAVFDGVTGKKIKAATGITSPSSGRLKMSSTAPYLTLHNTAHEDTDYGRESELIFKGEQSGGEETTLGIIQVAHDGTADDQKGIMSFKVNDGNDADAPGTKMTILADGNVGIGTESPGAKLEVENGSFPVLSVKRTTSTGTGVYGAMALERTRDDGSAFAGFGVGQYFLLEDSDGNEGDFAGFLGAKWQNATGGSEVGALVFTPAYHNIDPYDKVPSMVIVATSADTGNVGIGTTDPSAKLDINSDIIRLRTAKTPASAGAAGNQGDECWDANYHYRCVATNTWKRTALTTW